MKMTMKRTPLALAAFAAGALISTSAFADLVPLGPEDFGGTGVGTVSTLLTIQSPANTSTESGAVSFDGSADVITGDAKTGSSQTLTRVLGEVGVTSPESLRIIFNAVEPNANAITLESLTFSAYTSAGVNIFDASIAAPISYVDTFTGAGNSGFVFGLNSEQAASFSAAVNASGVSFASLRAGLSASASSAEGGFETFFIANSNLNPPVAAVPEPQTYALLLAGLAAVGFVARRRGSR